MTISLEQVDNKLNCIKIENLLCKEPEEDQSYNLVKNDHSPSESSMSDDEPLNMLSIDYLVDRNSMSNDEPLNMVKCNNSAYESPVKENEGYDMVQFDHSVYPSSMKENFELRRVKVENPHFIRIKKKRNQVKMACVNCQKACKKCSYIRPCSRCVHKGIADTCFDIERKPRKAGFKRGPYKKRKHWKLEILALVCAKVLECEKKDY